MRDFFRKKAPRSEDAQSDAAASGEAKQAKGRLILVVDDSPTETRIFHNALAKAGYSVETAQNGEEGVALARQLHPDLVLMDVVMPVLNGFQATRQLQRDPTTADIPVIMVTTKNQDTDRTWGMRQGAVDYLIKPIKSEELIHRVRAAIGE